MKLLDRLLELEQETKVILERAVYDCDIDEAGHKVKRCNQCMQNVGIRAVAKAIAFFI